MTIRHLKIFLEAARTGNFTRAAENLYLTQSAVSHAIGELEKEAGTALFERLSKSIRLTRSGEVLVQEAEPVLAACENLEKKLGNLEQEAPVSIVSSITIAIYYLPEILQAFSKRCPNTPVHTEVMPAVGAMECLKSGKADIALVEGIEPEEPYCGCVFSSCYMKAVCTPEYPAAGRIFTAEEFCGESLLLREKGSAVREVLDSSMYLKGYKVHPVWSSVNSTALLSAAKAGLGIAVLPDRVVKKELREKTLEEVKVEELTLVNKMAAVWHRDKYLSGPLQIFLELVSKRGEGEDCAQDYLSY